MLLSKLQRSAIRPSSCRGLRSAVAPVAVPAPRQGRARAVQVMAYRGTAKSESLMRAAREFIDCWAQGCKAEGPDDQLLRDLTHICDANIRVQAVHPLGSVEFEGFAGLRKKLEQDANFKSSMRPNRLLLCACDEKERSVFCLLECEEMGSMDEDVNLVLLELHCVGRTYGIVKLGIDVEEDGTTRVKSVTERMQLGPADACLLHMLYPEAHENGDASENKDSTGRMALKMASTWHFPREDIRATPLKGPALETAKRNIQQWCEARSSGNDAQAILSSIVDPNFALWDPYGVLPTVCGVRDSEGSCTYKGVQAESHQNCIMPLDAVVNRLNAIKESHLIKCDLIAAAICPNHNAGFSYWHSSMKHVVRTASGVFVDHDHEWPIEAMALHIFTPEGRIKDTWMLRDPYEIEKEMMEGIVAAGEL